jgi:serine/threonine protein kinase/tetratricopeptide (TPR) repeat protein
MQLQSGISLGPYEIVEPLGAGGMGEVYRAHDRRLGRDVAVKVLSRHLSGDPDAMARFEHEARTVAALSHPNILSIHDFAVEGGMPYTVTELLEGESLRERLERGPLAWREALALGIAIADGLAAAHGQGIVHRDLKPENLFLLRDGRLKILDFGLARYVPTFSGPSDTHLTFVGTPEHGLVMGTLGYMSPEQARGGPIGVTSDIFALGCVLYELVTGDRPFERETPADAIAAILHESPRPIGDSGAQVPAELARFVAHCLEKQPSARFQSARDAAVAMQALLHDSSERSLPGRRSSRGSTKAVAVLPFVNEGGDADLDYLIDGLTEILVNALSALPKLRVVPRTVVQRYKNRAMEPTRIGAELNATALVTGRVVSRGGQVSVQTELIDAPSNAQLWGQRFVRPASEVFALQEALAAEIVEALSSRLGGQKKAARRVRAAHTPAPAAYEHYLRGRHAFQRWGPRAFARAIEHYEQAILADPDYAAVWAGLSDVLGASAYFGYTEQKTSMARARSAAERALSLDATSAEAHAALAVSRLFGHWDFPGAAAAFEKSLSLNPRLATTHVFHSLYFAAHSRFDDALATARKAEALDPLSVLPVLSVVWACHFAGRDEEELAQVHRLLDLDPGAPTAYTLLAGEAERVGDYPLAIARLETRLRIAGDPPDLANTLRAGWEKDGRAGFLRAKLGAIEGGVGIFGSPAIEAAAILLDLGEPEAALDRLTAACDAHVSGVVLMGADRCFRTLHGHPRFNALLRRVGLPEPTA